MLKQKALKRTFYKKTSIKLAFTLAEVLITLGIIGVVAVFTIPTLMQKTQEAEYKTAYKKAFSVASQADRALKLDNEYASYPQGTYNFDLFKSKFSVAKDCSSNNNAECWNSSGEHACEGSCGGYQPGDTEHAFIDSSGMAWSNYFTGESLILVDTNGMKKPNRYGKDRWLFGLSTNGTKLYIEPDHETVNDFACHYPPCYATSWLYGDK